MSAPEFDIQSIQFGDGAVVVQFMRPTDVRVNGDVVIASQAVIDCRHPDYAEDADLLMANAVRMLRNALEDWESSPPFDPTADDDNNDDDDEGMGFP